MIVHITKKNIYKYPYNVTLQTRGIDSRNCEKYISTAGIIDKLLSCPYFFDAEQDYQY